MGTRERIIDAAAELLRINGYSATGLKQVSLSSGAAFGSVYHFFPGGKEELVAEALRQSGTGYQLLVEVVIDGAADLVTGIRDTFLGAAEALRLSDYTDACPIETVALEVASTNEPLRLVTADIFESWTVAVAQRYQAAGVSAAQARAVSLAVIGLLEGAFVLSRGLKSTAPMEAATDAAVALSRATIDEAAS